MASQHGPDRFLDRKPRIEQMRMGRRRAPTGFDCSFPQQVEVDPVTAQFGEITPNPTEGGIEFHPDRDHAIACHQPGVPNLAPPVGVLVFVWIGRDLFASSAGAR
jgi:hypothetical protein